jgi:uncharacterized protein (DUF1697 family)
MNYIALLRGINVSGKNLIKMNDLVFQLQNIGYQNVKTYIQSGNIIFSSLEDNSKTIEIQIHNMILKEFGLNVPVLVINQDKLKKVHENNPFIKTTNMNIDKLHVTFLNAVPSKENIQKLADYKNLDDKFVAENDTIYICCPNGYGSTKLNNTFFENKLKVSATTRNWKTIGKLVEMADLD